MRVSSIFVASAALPSVFAATASVGPVQKVVELLQSLKGKVQADQEKEAAAFDAQDKWCRQTDLEKVHDIGDSARIIDEKKACVDSRNAITQSKDAEIAEIGGRLATAERDLQAATTIRDNEYKLFQEKDQDLSETLDTLERAVTTIKRELGKTPGVGLLQQQRAARQAKEMQALSAALSAVVEATWVPMQQRKVIQDFLQDDGFDWENPKAAAYEGHGGGIVETLAGLRDRADESQAAARTAEINARHAFELLKQSLLDATAVDKKQLEAARQARHEAAKEQAECASIQAATEAMKAEDEDYLTALRSSCQIQTDDFAHNTESRRQEVLAVDHAVDVLTSEASANAMAGAAAGAPASALLQVPPAAAAGGLLRRSRAAHFLEALGGKIHSVALAQVAFRLSASAPFDKVRGLIAQMIDRLQAEAIQESSHKDWCDEETKETESKLERTKARLSELGTRIESATAAAAELNMQISQLQTDINNIDQQQAEATQIRRLSKAANEQQMKDAQESQQALRTAITTLRNYYSGSGAALVQQRQPRTGATARKLATAVTRREDSHNAGSATGVVGLLEVAESDFLTVETQTKALEEQQAADFTALSQKNAVSRATKEAEIHGKQAEVTSIDNARNNYQTDNSTEAEEYAALTSYRENLRKSCEYTAPPFEVRAKQREQEIQGLRDALNILAGEEAASAASTSLLQSRVATRSSLRSVRVHKAA